MVETLGEEAGISRWTRLQLREHELRVPAVGDIGLVVDIDGSSGKIIYTVECTAANGSERWLSDFVDDELDLLPRG